MRWRRVFYRWQYMAGIIGLGLMLVFQGWTWGNAATVVLLVVVAYQFVGALIDERIARWTWPRVSDRDEATPPHVPNPRIWTFEFEWAVPFIERIVTARGFPCSRELMESDGKTAIETIKIEEFTGRARIHEWRVRADGGAGSYYYWEDRPVTWFDSKDPIDRDDLIRDGVWTLNFTELFDPLGPCRLVLSAQWRRDDVPYLCLILWLDSWSRNEGGRAAVDVIFEAPLNTALLDKAPAPVESTGFNAWSARRGEGDQWEWSWQLSSR